MSTFVLMTRLNPETLHGASARRAMGKAWLDKVKTACPEVKFIAHYALLGQVWDQVKDLPPGTKVAGIQVEPG